MSKWIWCGAVVLTLGAGAAAVKLGWISRQGPAEVIIVDRPPEPRPNDQGEVKPNPVLPRMRPAVLADLNEPIMTQAEPAEPTFATVPALPPLAGADESEAGAAQAPRPDVELRRMPYADEPAFVNRVLRPWPQIICADIPSHLLLSTPLSSWSGLARLVLADARANAGAAEESEEPPLLEPPTPSHYPPSHCPGHCPYPGSYRYGPLR